MAEPCEECIHGPAGGSNLIGRAIAGEEPPPDHFEDSALTRYELEVWTYFAMNALGGSMAAYIAADQSVISAVEGADLLFAEWRKRAAGLPRA